MYYRQDITVGVKLPVKWMALESIHDAVFSEKSDVVRQCGGIHVCVLYHKKRRMSGLYIVYVAKILV